MKPSNGENGLHDALFDRLVDGALGETERRALLGRLEAVPDGWRRCAVAFLEAQAWRAALATPAASAPDAERTDGRGGRRRVAASGSLGVSAAYRRLAGAAAGLIVAFATGWAAGDAARAPETVRVGTPPRAVSDPAWQTADARARPASIERPPNARRPVEFVFGPDVDPSWLEQDPAVLPISIRQRLEHQGYQVEQRHALMSMPLGDDSRLAVPVDEVELRFVGNRTY